jgi:hypothetical protein
VDFFSYYAGLPSIFSFPPNCKTADCLIRFEGELSADAITDWFATTVLGLPRVFYHTKETLVSKFLSKVPPNKVCLAFFYFSLEYPLSSVLLSYEIKEILIRHVIVFRITSTTYTLIFVLFLIFPLLNR